MGPIASGYPLDLAGLLAGEIDLVKCAKECDGNDQYSLIVITPDGCILINAEPSNMADDNVDDSGNMERTTDHGRAWFITPEARAP
jgi:hypothetical protein